MDNDDRCLDSPSLCNRGGNPNPILGDGPLQMGDRRKEVTKKLQRMLKELGYDLGNTGPEKDGVDGAFGKKTLDAVTQYQQDETHKDWEGKELDDDGLVGPRTSDSLNREMVGIWYDYYKTDTKITEGKRIITLTSDFLSDPGLELEDLKVKEEAEVMVKGEIATTQKVVRGDFLVLTKNDINADSDFESTDRVVIKDKNDRIHTLLKRSGKVLIRPNVIVIGRFPDGTRGDPNIPTGRAVLKVENSLGDEKSDEITIKIINPPPISTKTVITFGEENTFYYVGIIANPAIQDAGKTGNDPPFTPDPILKDRPAFHKKAVEVLESLLDRGEDFLRNPEIEPHLKVYIIFDDSLNANADNSLLRRDQNSNYLFPRSFDLPDLFNKFLKPYEEKADVLALITADTQRKLRMAWFTTDSTTGTDFTYGNTKYIHGQDVKTPGAFADHIEKAYGGAAADKMTSLHEFLHAMSEKKQRIIDLYNDNVSTTPDFNVNKKARANNPSGSNIPQNFSEYNKVTYKSDRPQGSYTGRGGLGYPGVGNIEESHGPELRETSNPNIMDNYPSASDPLRSKLDKLTYQYVTDRIKAKIR